MPHRKSQLKLNKQGVAVNADIRMAKLDPEDVVTQPSVVRRHAETGESITSETYDKATGQRLEEGYGFRYVTESGEEVSDEEIQLYQVTDDDVEEQFTLYEPTLGGERTVNPFTWIPIETIDQYLIERTYEIWGEDPSDVAQLYDLANLIRIYEEAPVIEVVLRRSKYMSWGIISPQFFDDSFALILRITRQKITPGHQMPIPAGAVHPDDEEAPKLQQDTPF